MTERFSDRQGYRPPAARITVREDAPSELRSAIHLIASGVGMTPDTALNVICQVLLEMPDWDNWPEYVNPWQEVARLMEEASWYKVYDIAEALYAALTPNHATIAFRGEDKAHQSADEFERRLNDFFVERGIGWELRDGRITHRGSEAFARSTHEVPDHLDDSGFQRAANEMREAPTDISRRPEPDITGAVQHAMAALEATAREVADQPNLTLGKLVPELDLPVPLDRAVHKLWGYASERCRHIRERQAVDHAEADLIVAVAGALCGFLAHRRP